MENGEWREEDRYMNKRGDSRMGSLGFLAEVISAPLKKLKFTTENTERHRDFYIHINKIDLKCLKA